MYTSTFYCFLFFSSILLGHEFAGQLRPSATLSWDDHQVSFIQLPQKSAIGLPLVPPVSKRVEYGPELPPGYGILASSLPVSETEVEGVCTADEAPTPSALSCIWAALNSFGAHWLDRVRLIILDPESALMQLYKVRLPVEALTSSTPPSITLVLPPVEDLEEADGEVEVVLPTRAIDKGEKEEDEAPETQQVQVGSTWYSVVETSAADGLPACAYPNASRSTLTPCITLVQPTASDNSDSQVDYVNDFLNSTMIHRVNEVPLIDLMQIFSLVAGLLFAAFLRIAGHVEEIKEKNVAEAEQRSQLQYRRVLKLMQVRKISHFVRSHVRSLTYRNGKLRRSVKKTKGQLETSHSRFISLLSSSHLRESSSNETILSLRNQLALVEAQLEKSHSSMVSLLSSSQQRETTANESILSLCSQYNQVEEKREEKSKEVEEKSKEVETLTTAKQEVEERLKNSLALIAVLTSHISSLKEDNKEQRRTVRSYEAEERRKEEEKEEKDRQEAERLQREEIEREEKERAQQEIEIAAAMKEEELSRRVRQEEEDKRRREAKEAEEQRKKEMELREKALAAIRAREAEAKKVEAEKRAEAERRAEEKKAEEKRAEDKKAADVGTHVEKKYSPYSHFNTSKRSKKLSKMAKKQQQSPDTTVDPIPVPPAAPQQKEKEKEKQTDKQERKRNFRPSEVYRPPRTAAAHYPQE